MNGITATQVGLLTGVALGFAGAFGGFGAFLTVLVMAVIGLLVGRVLDGEVDVSDYLGGARSRRDR